MSNTSLNDITEDISNEETDASSSPMSSNVSTPLDTIPSPIETPSNNLFLNEFRAQWKQELTVTVDQKINANGSTIIAATNHNGNNVIVDEPMIDGATEPKTTTTIEIINKDDVDKAKALFTEGAKLEQLGKVFDAMHLYRRAVQIVPDIEKKIYESSKKTTILNVEQDNSEKSKDGWIIINESDGDGDNHDEIEDLEDVDLLTRFQTQLMEGGYICERATSSDKSVLITGLHLSDLPIEIILYILRWVVSKDLDLRSLEQVAAVSKGLYTCARDPEIWKQACIRIWGANALSCSSMYPSWRQMFLDRHRVHFNGCYISKTTYHRLGENSFQDQFYRPFHLIDYYRYVRFFPNGTLLMLTSSEDPQQCVNRLKNPITIRKGICKGHFRLSGDVVTIIVKKPRTHNRLTQQQQQQQQQVQQVQNLNADVSEFYTFHIELNITGSTKRKFCSLKWKNYSIIENDNITEISTDFEITQAKYPPLLFSRVKSYTDVAEEPLI